MLVGVIISVLVASIVALIMIIFDISVGQLLTLPHLGQSIEILSRNQYGKLGLLLISFLTKNDKKK